MTKRVSLWAGVLAASLVLGAAAQAQDGSEFPEESGETSGALLIHGNYCGPGNRGWNVPPVDALDAACRRHDLCTPDNGLPTCACNHRLQFEANLIAQSPRQPDDLRALAGIVSAGAALLPCRYGT